MHDRKYNRLLYMRIDADLDRELSAAAKAAERTLCQEARFRLKRSFAVEEMPAEDKAGAQ